jgi:hypothetical protein
VTGVKPNPGSRIFLPPVAEFEPSWAKSKPEFLNMNAGSSVLAQVDVFEPRLLDFSQDFLEDLKHDLHPRLVI